ncbi:biotin/lipoyl-containing protein [Chitinibacter sp. FCG-7]|uniref:Biotin/lipoyl-containing protein n=1 Tax=Chitinibacter mangrovi TaxID=3153927 RepID=A0AAU7FCI7_9NEIS
MTISYTTHLICAPDLPEAAEVLVFHVKPGQFVGSDTLLMTLLAADQEWPVHAPDDGQIGSLMVEHGDFVNSNDLLLLMEIAEKPSAFALLDFDAEDTSAAHTIVAAPPPITEPVPAAGQLAVSSAAATLAARLGVDLNRLSTETLIDEDAVLEFARQELLTLGKIRKLLA